jgi:hypothetical protein
MQAVNLPPGWGIENPFKTPEGSRVTASGFTDLKSEDSHRSEVGSVGRDEIRRMIDDYYETRIGERFRDRHVDGDTVIVDPKPEGSVTGLRTSRKKSDSKRHRKMNGDPMAEIHPDDSASFVGFQQGKSQVSSKGSELTTSTIKKYGSMYDNVIGGYGLTAEEKMEELEEMMQITSVSGLSRVFIDERLNFLMHLHNQLYKLLRKGDNYPDPDSLGVLTNFVRSKKGKERSPHEDLLYQVISSTISFRRMRVKSNPFNIPLLEAGMTLTNKIIYMTFCELNNEYRTVWFGSMKDVEVPAFHGSYKGMFTKAVKFQSSQKKGSSVLGF